MKVFLDANIFFAAAGSPNGGSGFVLELGKVGKFTCVTVLYALVEAERNIKNKLGNKALERHYQNLLDVRPVIQPIGNIDNVSLAYLKALLPLKDIPILLGAIMGDVQFLITLDKRDFLQNKKLTTLNLPFKILSPGDFLTKVVR